MLFDPIDTGHHLEYAEYLSKYMLEHGDEVTFATWSASSASDLQTRTGVTLLPLGHGHPSPFSRGAGRFYSAMAWAFFRSYRAARRDHFDVLHHLYLDRSEVATRLTIVGRQEQPRVFATLFAPHFVAGRTSGLSLRRARRYASERALSSLLTKGSIETLFVHSDRIRQLALDATSGRAADRIAVVPDPAPSPASGSREETRTSLHLDPHTVLLLFFGDLRPAKGLDVLLEALPLVRRDVDWRLLIVGTPHGKVAEQVDECRERLDRPSRILQDLRFVPDEAAMAYFSAADFVVLPYKRSFSGTSGVLQHSAAAGRPVIATDVGDVGSTVREHGLGVVTEPENPSLLADAISGAVMEPRKRLSLVQPTTEKYARAFAWTVLGELVRSRYGATGDSVIPSA